MEGIRVINRTRFFKRGDLKLYSLGDLRMPRGISLTVLGYGLAFAAVWSLPLVLIFGFHLNPFFLAFAFGPPIALGIFANKPIFGGKTLVGFSRTMINFMKQPQAWLDLYEEKNINKNKYYIYKPIWISRRRELTMLFNMKEERKNSKKRRRRKK